MEIHEVVDDSALQVVLYLVDDDLLAHIDQFHICQVLFILIDCLVHLFIIPYPVAKVHCSCFWILAYIVGRCGLDLQDVCHDGLFGIALGFNIERLDAVGFTALTDPSSSSLCRICSVQYGDSSSICLEPVEHVFDSGFCSSVPHPLAFFVGRIEKVSRGLWCILSAVDANIEGLGFYR